jgi:hypothetical protein
MSIRSGFGTAVYPTGPWAFANATEPSHGLVEEALRRSHVALRRQQEVDGLALLVDGAVEILPDALDLDVRLIHTPAAPDRALVFPDHFLDERQETNRPPVDRRMVDRYAALLHDLLEMPVA